MADSPADEFTLMDDFYMKKFFDGRPDLAAEILSVVLNMPDLKLESAQTEKLLPSYLSHSAKLDVFCKDADGNLFDLEFQDDPTRAPLERAQFYASALLMEGLPKGGKYRDLPQIYVVFITNGNAIGRPKPVRRFEWVDVEKGWKEDDADGEGDDSVENRLHITYVDASYNGYGDTKMGRMVHDVMCPSPVETLSPLLAQRARDLKEQLKGDKELETYTQKIRREGIEEGKLEGRAEGRQEGRQEGRLEGRLEGRREGRLEGRQEERADMIAMLVRDGSLSLEKIAKMFGITVDEARSYGKGGRLETC